MADKNECLIKFQSDISQIPLPSKFTFPFYYEPHQLSIIAASELQDYLHNQTDWDHNFGIDRSKEGMVIGKMFGVLVVKDENEELGYLTAFSGKLAGRNNHKRFVPPIYDMLNRDGTFLTQSKGINNINAEIERVQSDPSYLLLLEELKHLKQKAEENIADIKSNNKKNRNKRKSKRGNSYDSLSEENYQKLLKALSQKSIQDKIFLKTQQEQWSSIIDEKEIEKAHFDSLIEKLKEERKRLSLRLQNWLFNQYQFLSYNGEYKSLLEIFSNSKPSVPPAGAGECAAPKLLQYAYKNKLTPIAMAEFWWGESLSEVRIHGQYYPACTGKCMPILSHMMKGLEVDENPMLISNSEVKAIEIIYEDSHLAVIHKPPELLSVPGKNIKDSVLTRMKTKYPSASGPLIVHRLDMSTSGIMIIPKTEKAYKYVQRQFIKRTISKRYTAILNGIVSQDSGHVNLPLRVDLDDRPRQLVCYEHGKAAKTNWKVIERVNGTTKVHFYPITGRTHQLRVHAAHPLGLNTPIVGDDLYGTRGNRLMLHAESITFVHPEHRKKVTFTIKAEF